MKSVFLLFTAGFLALVILPGTGTAQTATLNPGFETYTMQHWTGTDSTYVVTLGSSTLGMVSYCLRKFPGTPDNNGAVSQSVHLLAGQTYEFRANIASKYCST